MSYCELSLPRPVLDIYRKSHDKILSKIVQMAKDAGLTASDISKAMDAGNGGKTAKAVRAAKKNSLAGKKVPAKYRNPANPEQSWTGRGVEPTWVQSLKAAGTSESALNPTHGCSSNCLLFHTILRPCRG